MARKSQGSGFERAARAFQSNVASAGPVAAASYTLVGGIILLGGIGYAVDRWWGTPPWGLVIGLALGIVVGFYELIKTAYAPPAGGK
jgi:ATP synthase protein I